ncbi:hypothetical protein KP79_PYT12429 [Mizuhopecten yessoensis]|uniref:Uncharacterized protein n=1 Tax=Mizuhopecten yessoensis TaxID=6573 RepID=A0A210QJP1_MIZYE|nr:hypothetical protein KP79_PYT12429 [Mizuhopecten yessoensis]
MWYEVLLWSGFLILPLNAGISFGGTYCVIHTCTGLNEVYCDSGCCTDDGVGRCCPNTMMVVVGTIFGTLLMVMVLAAVIVICLRRNRRKLHALNKYMDQQTQTLSKPPGPSDINRPAPSLPPEALLNI